MGLVTEVNASFEQLLHRDLEPKAYLLVRVREIVSAC